MLTRIPLVTTDALREADKIAMNRGNTTMCVVNSMRLDVPKSKNTSQIAHQTTIAASFFS